VSCSGCRAPARQARRCGSISSATSPIAVWSGGAKKVWVCLFDEHDRETHRVPLSRGKDGVFAAHIPGLKAKQRYGFRADGDYDPGRGLWFDPDKLLTDPYAVELDRPYRYDRRLSTPKGQGGDTAFLMPKSIVKELPQATPATPFFQPGGLIYELQVRAFTKLHPDVPAERRGTVGALAHPAIIEHLKKLHVSAVELMPVTAWMDERHLQPLGLTNAWGYNPVSFMALDPRLCPGGVAELRETVEALHAAGIGVILDLVFNHTAESDRYGPILSLRGLDARAYYRMSRGRLVNDTGTGNTVACDHPVTQRLVLDSLRHFVRHAGIDGFRFDLAPILGRDRKGFDPNAPLFRAMCEDTVLKDRVLIAEPWDVGSNGYQLGNFRQPFLEWNDRCRDDVRRFWRGDRGLIGALATRLAGSSDVFQRDGQPVTRSVNFIAAHDGFSLADMVAYERKHNEANGEKNRDGHNENLSWNNGVEGEPAGAKVLAARKRDIRALLATLFASRGAIMLTAGDEFGRTQRGNNNAYCQDNELTWLDWQGRDPELEAYVLRLAEMRLGLVPPPLTPPRKGEGAASVSESPSPLRGGVRGGGIAASALSEIDFLTGQSVDGRLPDVQWLTETGKPMDNGAWEDPQRCRLAMLLGPGAGKGGRLAVLINGDRRAISFVLPSRNGYRWRHDAMQGASRIVDGALPVEGRAVEFASEVAE
jgi:glycogen operon protein